MLLLYLCLPTLDSGITAVHKTDNEATIDSLKEALEFAELWKKNGWQFKLCVQNPSLNLRRVSPNRKSNFNQTSCLILAISCWL